MIYNIYSAPASIFILITVRVKRKTKQNVTQLLRWFHLNAIVWSA